MIVHLTTDLMLASEVRIAANQSGKALRLVDGVDQLTAIAAETPIEKLVVDLQTKGLQLDRLAQWLAENSRPAEIVLYAQHVNTELLDQAKDLAIGRVLTRGQFHRQLGDLVAR